MAALYLVVGPAGVGKKELLDASMKALDNAGNDNVAFVKRDVTRGHAVWEWDKCCELDVPKTDCEYDTALAAGEYAISWVDPLDHVKFGFRQGVVEQHLAAKKRCVVSVSRTVVDECIRKWRGKDVEVYVLSVTVSEEELRHRLTTIIRRGKKTLHRMEEMVKHAMQNTPSGPHVIHIRNEVEEEGMAAVVDALNGKLRYVLWLAPAIGSPFQEAMSRVMGQLSAEYGTTPSSPHVTLCPSFEMTHRDALACAVRVAGAIGHCVPCNLTGELSIDSTKPFKALALEVETSEAVAAATVTARRCVFKSEDAQSRDAYAPHCSLLYGVENDVLKTTAGLQEARDKALLLLAAETKLDSFEATRLVIAVSTGPECWLWDEVRSYELVSRNSWKNVCSCAQS